MNEDIDKFWMLEEIIEMYPDEDILIADGFDNAIIGIDINTMRVIYSVSKVIEIIMKNPDISESDAYEHFEFNIAGAYMGEKTPIWCYDNF